MCRYILSTPPKPEDKAHKLRVIFGNGLRPQIWKEFVERFNIPRVGEFYGATEGNANIGGLFCCLSILKSKFFESSENILTAGGQRCKILKSP